MPEFISRPIFSLYYHEWRVDLLMLKETPTFFYALLAIDGGQKASEFWENIRVYNSIFAFTLIGEKIDN